jgi:hypothetical protein
VACLLSNHRTSPYRARLAGEPVLLTPEQQAEVSAKIHDYGQSKQPPAL